MALEWSSIWRAKQRCTSQPQICGADENGCFMNESLQEKVHLIHLLSAPVFSSLCRRNVVSVLITLIYFSSGCPAEDIISLYVPGFSHNSILISLFFFCMVCASKSSTKSSTKSRNRSVLSYSALTFQHTVCSSKGFCFHMSYYLWKK